MQRVLRWCTASFASPTAFVVMILISTITCGHAQEESQPPYNPDDTQHLTLKLVDPERKPVRSAYVRPGGIVCIEDEGKVGYSWPIAKVGREPEWVSDEDGIVEIDFPIRFRSDHQWRTAKQISFCIRHVRFLEKIYSHNAVGDELEVELVPGCEVIVSAKDRLGKRTDAFAIMPLRMRGSVTWGVTAGNKKFTRSMPPGVFPCLMVSPQDDGKTLFAGTFPVTARTDRSFTLRDIPLNPGIEVVGNLPSYIPRPIIDGKVFVECSPKIIGYDGKEPVQATAFRDWKPIDPEGSFVFPSLPATGTLQVIAVCGGWISSGRNDGLVSGDLLYLDKLDVKNNSLAIVPEMHRAGSLGITLRKPDGRPVVAASVQVDPNVYWSHRGQASILGVEFSDLDWIRSEQQPDSYYVDRIFNYPPTRLRRTTNEQGFAVLEDLPLDVPLEVYIDSSKFTLPIQPEHLQRMVPVNLKSPGQTNITLQTEPVNEE